MLNIYELTTQIPLQTPTQTSSPQNQGQEYTQLYDYYMGRSRNGY